MGRGIQCSGGTRPISLHSSRSGLDSGEKRVVGEVGVAHGRLVIGVPQNPSDCEQVDAGIDHEGRRRMPQVVYAEIGKLRRDACGIPRMLDAGKGLPGLRVGYQVGAPIEPGQLGDDVDRGLRQRYMPRLAGLGCRDKPRPAIHIDILPFSVQQLGDASAGQQQQPYDMLELRIAGVLHRLMQSLGLRRGQIAVAGIVDRPTRDVPDRVLVEARNVPAAGQLE